MLTQEVLYQLRSLPRSLESIFTGPSVLLWSLGPSVSTQSRKSWSYSKPLLCTEWDWDLGFLHTCAGAGGRVCEDALVSGSLLGLQLVGCVTSHMFYWTYRSDYDCLCVLAWWNRSYFLLYLSSTLRAESFSLQIILLLCLLKPLVFNTCLCVCM